MQRDERHDVDGADARVHALVLAQVDRGRRRREQTQHGVLHRRRLSGEGVDRAVVRRIG